MPVRIAIKMAHIALKNTRSRGRITVVPNSDKAWSADVSAAMLPGLCTS
jgi:hypothetical protein